MHCCIFLRRRNVPSSLAHCDREKEKSVEFANGSLLRSDSRIFVQHPGAFPLFRTRFSRFLLPLSPVFLASLLPLISLFQSSPIPRHRRTSSSSLSTLLFLGSFFSFPLFVLLRLDASYFLVRILNFSFPHIAQVFIIIAYLF